MKTEALHLVVNHESVSAEWTRPEKPVAIMTLAHGAGAGMNHPFMKRLAEELTRFYIASLRFNFLYMEKGSKRPDPPAVAHRAVEAAFNQAKEDFPKLPLFLAGKSFGGRMSSQWLSLNSEAAVKGIIFFGFPLHPAGKPGIERAEHLNSIKKPLLFLQGTRDELAHANLIRQVTRGLSQATLVEFDGADHSFKVGKHDLIPLLAEAVANWIRKV